MELKSFEAIQKSMLGMEAQFKSAPSILPFKNIFRNGKRRVPLVTDSWREKDDGIIPKNCSSWKYFEVV